MAFEPKQFGRFYLLEKLAMGGMAEIYKAKTYGAEGFEKLLAIKRILPHCSADKEFIHMLIDEAKLSVLLSHANIVQVYDLGKVGEDYFISMEFINGVNLREIFYRCRELERTVPEDLAVYMASEICKGLDYAHRKTDTNGAKLEIVHRDVSPQNILISYEGEVKIVDFGIAKAAMNMSHTMVGILKGKIAYMSPEQALGKTIDYRTDLFSTGLIFYEALTGKKMFTGDSQFEVLKKIRSTKVAFEALPATVASQLRSILAKALAYAPRDRYPSAGDMQSELTRFLYSTYVDFTPQRLAAFLREIFSAELQRRQQQAVARHQREHPTASVSLRALPVQEDIVYRPGVPGLALPAQPARLAPDESSVPTAVERTPIGPSIPLPPERSLSDFAPAPQRSVSRGIAVMAGVAAVVAGVVIAAQWWPQSPTPPQAPMFGSVQIHSQPGNAEILLDGVSMGQFTPALIKNLRTNTTYTITLRKSGYADYVQPLTPLSDTPIRMEVALIAKAAPPATAPTVAPTPPVTPQAPVQAIEGPARPASDRDAASRLPTAPKDIAPLSGTAPKKPAATPTDTAKPVPREKKSPVRIESPSDKSAPPGKDRAATRTPDTQAIGKGTITVNSRPIGATVYVDGKRFGRTPLSIRGLASNVAHSVRVEKTGYTTWESAVQVDHDQEATVNAALQRTE